jgi:phage terminase small subunit
MASLTRREEKGLTTLQQRFVEEYMVDMNAAQACLRAGYNTKASAQMGLKVLRHPRVAAEIAKKMQKKREETKVTENYVINKLVMMAENPEAKDADQLRALELLGRSLGMFRDRQEISGPDGAAIQYQQRVEQDDADLARAIARLAKREGENRVALRAVPRTESES